MIELDYKLTIPFTKKVHLVYWIVTVESQFFEGKAGKGESAGPQLLVSLYKNYLLNPIHFVSYKDRY